MAGKKAIIPIDFGEEENPPKEQLDKFQKAHRPADLKRATFYTKTQSKLDKQERVADIFDKEKAELEMYYKKSRGGAFLREEAMWLKQFEGLLKRQATSTAIKEEETLKIKEIDEKLRQTDKQIHQLRLQLIQIRKNKYPVIPHERVIQMLENKLHQKSIAHNKILHKSSILREYVEHLSILQNRFQVLNNKYNGILSKGREKIRHLCEEAKGAQNQRNEIKGELLSLDKQSCLQYNQLIEELQEISRLVKQKSQHIPFMMKKQKIRTGYAEGENEKVDTKPEEQLKFYQNISEKIKSVTQQTDPCEIVKRFIQAEEDNFKLFNYANELVDECEHVQEKIGSFEGKLRDAQRQDENEDDEFNIKKEAMQEKLREIEVRKSALQENIHSCQNTLHKLNEEIKKLYNKCECTDQHLHNLVGEELTKDNILDYLSILESWVCDVIHFSDYLTFLGKASSQTDKEVEKTLPSPKQDVTAYAKLSGISGSTTPSTEMPFTSRKFCPKTEDIRTMPFPKFNLPQLIKKPNTSTAANELRPYTRSELKITAIKTLHKP